MNSSIQFTNGETGRKRKGKKVKHKKEKNVGGTHEEEMNGRIERWRDNIMTSSSPSSCSCSLSESRADVGEVGVEVEAERGRPRYRQGSTRNRRRVTRGREEDITFSQRLAAAQERIATERERRLMQEMLGGEFMPHPSSASSSSSGEWVQEYYDEDEEERNNAREEEERRRMEGEEDETRGNTVEVEHTATTSAEVDSYAEDGIEPHGNAKGMRELEEMLRDRSIRGWILRKFAIQKKIQFSDGEEHAPATLVSDDAVRLQTIDAMYQANGVADDALHDLAAQPWVVIEVKLEAQRTRSWESSLGVAHPYEGWMIGRGC